MRNMYRTGRGRSHVGGSLLVSLLLAIVALFAMRRAAKIQPRMASPTDDPLSPDGPLEEVQPVGPAEIIGYLQRRPAAGRYGRHNGSMQTVAWCMEHAAKGKRLAAKYKMIPVRSWDEEKLAGSGCNAADCSVEWGIGS